MFKNVFFLNSCRLCDCVEKYCTAIQATDDNIIRCICIDCWITKATDTHSEYVIIMASPRQQWFHESPSVLRLYTHVCVVKFLLSYLVELETIRSPYFHFVGLRDCVEHYFGIASLGYSYLALIQFYCKSRKTNAEIF
jgi:hypothetical protein